MPACTGGSRKGKLNVYPRILPPHLAPKTKVPCIEEAMKFPRPGLEVNKLQGLDPAPKDPLPIQKDGMGREVGGGFRMGNTCITNAGEGVGKRELSYTVHENVS